MHSGPVPAPPVEHRKASEAYRTPNRTAPQKCGVNSTSHRSREMRCGRYCNETYCLRLPVKSPTASTMAWACGYIVIRETFGSVRAGGHEEMVVGSVGIEETVGILPEKVILGLQGVSERAVHPMYEYGFR